MHVITDSLAVGNVEDAKCPPSSISVVLLVAQEYDISPPRQVTFAKVPLKEFSEADPYALQFAIEWLEQHAKGSKLLVCCRAGMGRSVSVAIGYCCCVMGMTYADALALVKARRPGATPLPGLERTIQKVLELRNAPAQEPAAQRSVEGENPHA